MYVIYIFVYYLYILLYIIDIFYIEIYVDIDIDLRHKVVDLTRIIDSELLELNCPSVVRL